MKKILLFFPENPLKKDSGNKIRVLELLKYFKHRDFEVDFVGPQYIDFNESDARMLEQSGLVNNCYLIHRKPVKSNFFKYLFTFKIPSLLYKSDSTLNFVTYNFQAEFNQILERNSYDFIMISYVGWAQLIKSNHLIKKAKTIIDTHDFATVQAQSDKNFDLGKYFAREIENLNLFDEIWAISPDELFVFSQFAQTKVRLIPFVTDRKFDSVKPLKWDVIYVASANSHNTKSAQWFFEQVYPLLPPQLKICVIGKVSATIAEYPNVAKYLQAVDLNLFYSESRIAICPMLTGSGVKIKVVEALSFGLPVVCTTRGVDGLVNKTDNGCMVSDDAKEFADYITKLSTDGAFYNENASKARAFFIKNFDIKQAYSKIDASFSSEIN